jgi:hypothetical protein
MAASRTCASDASLARLAAGTASKEEVRRAVAHLLRGCADCAARLRAQIRPPIPEAAYDAALDHFEAGLQAALEAPLGPLSRLWSVVESEPPPPRRAHGLFR